MAVVNFLSDPATGSALGRSAAIGVPLVKTAAATAAAAAAVAVAAAAATAAVAAAVVPDTAAAVAATACSFDAVAADDPDADKDAAVTVAAAALVTAIRIHREAVCIACCSVSAPVWAPCAPFDGVPRMLIAGVKDLVTMVPVDPVRCLVLSESDAAPRYIKQGCCT